MLEAAEKIDALCDHRPSLGLVLGTGLNDLADEIESATAIAYEDIPHFPLSTVRFHKGRLLFGRLAGQAVMVMQGRFHYYEGHAAGLITLPIRVMHLIGVQTLILTNAAGSIRPALRPGSIAVIRDHINLMGTNPLIGPYDPFLGERFPDMSEPYSIALQQAAHRCAKELDIDLMDTLYAAVSGPCFETKAEIRMLNRFDVDTVGMSVVPEVLVARQLKMNVLALSAITDQTLPDQMQPISHQQVARVANKIAPQMSDLLKAIIDTISVHKGANETSRG